MATTASRFWPDTGDWDGTDPAGGDVRRNDTDGTTVTNSTSICNFGTSGAKTITVDPQTSRTTTGLDSGFGFAVNIAGADGMDSTAAAKRWIKAGAWYFQGQLTAGPVSSTVACTVGMNVYRVAAAPATTRTLLFSDSVSAGIVAAAGTDWDRTTASQPEIVLEAGETIQVTYTLTCTGQLGGLTIAFRLSTVPISGNPTWFDVPSPGILTLGEGTGTAAGVAAADGAGGKVLATVGESAGVATVTGQMSARADTTGTAVGTSTVTGLGSAVAGTTGTATGSGTATGLASIVLAMTGTVDIGGGAPADYTPNDGLKTITGVTRDTTGTAVGSKTVKLFRQSDDFLCATTTSHATTGVYTFGRDSTDPNTYYVLAYDPAVQLHGVSDRSLAPV